MSEVQRYAVCGEHYEIYRDNGGDFVQYEDYAALQQKLDAIVAENAALKSSRAVLAENTLETCNAIASAGFRHEAIMRGLMQSTGNGNKYPHPITTLVDEALRHIKTPETEAYLNTVRADILLQFFNEQMEWAIVNWQWSNFTAMENAAIREGDCELSGVILMLKKIADFEDEIRSSLESCK